MEEPVAIVQGGAVPVADLPVAAPVAAALSARLSISTLFDVQAAVVAHVDANPDRDVVLCAPTGSGKTLCYAIPILSRLCSRVVPRLRAVIVVPTRDLAAQVHRVLAALAAETDLTISVAVGASSVKREAVGLRGSDVLVATPGRLVEHARHTPGFSLGDVQYLVLDESDRLLHDSYYGWIEAVVPECGKARVLGRGEAPTGLAALAIHRAPCVAGGPRRRPLIMLASATQTRDPKRLTLLDLHRPVQFIAAISSSHRPPAAGEAGEFDDADVDPIVFRVPESLVECAYVLGQVREKPAALTKLLGLWDCTSGGGEAVVEPLRGSGSKLVFTNSIESAHRLARLLELLASRAECDFSVLEMSGDLSAERRAFVVDAVKRARTVIVCSDVLARGMDIDGVDAVINYDVPVHVNTYVHRVGRTARAGREGVSVSLVLGKQARHFKALVRTIDRGDAKIRVRSVVGAQEGFDVLSRRVEVELHALRRVLRREQLGLVRRDHSLPDHVLRDLQPTAAPLAGRRNLNAHVHPDRLARVEAAVEQPVEAEAAEEEEFSHLLRAQVARNFLSAPPPRA
jgi:ATP-dependent RNA helicase DDX51/DBP6